MNDFKHFILTRFNIPFIRKDSVDFLFSDSYLNERYSIFENTCFSSMCNQKNKDFIWLVFFDKRRPSLLYIGMNNYRSCAKILSQFMLI